MMLITVALTPAQLRLVNSALALLEADEHDSDYRQGVMARARGAVWDAMARAGIDP